MDLPSHFCFPLMQFIGELIILKTNDSVIPRKGGGGFQIIVMGVIVVPFRG